MEPARNLGKYRLVAALGQGGMAEVFLAMAAGPQGTGFSKLAVVKRLRSHLVEDPEFIALLVDEARISARLNHPNVVQTLEVDVDNGEYFFAMEFLDGQPLHRIQHRARHAGFPLSSDHQYLVVADTLAGLQHAHELHDYDGTPMGVVHRDVTPQNIFVTYEGQVKVVDFGIAKAAGRISETKAGIVKGKLRYMSPEQATGQPVDCRTDIFAAGVLLWEAATHRKFWADAEETEIVGALIEGAYDPSPRSVDPNVPKAIDRMCRKAMAFHPGNRFASAAEFRADLEAFVANGARGTRRTLGARVTELFVTERRKLRELVEQSSKSTVEPMSVVTFTAASVASRSWPAAPPSIAPVVVGRPSASTTSATSAAEEPKAEEPKAEEPKAEEPKAEEPKAEEPKAEEPQPVAVAAEPTGSRPATYVAMGALAASLVLSFTEPRLLNALDAVRGSTRIPSSNLQATVVTARTPLADRSVIRMKRLAVVRPPAFSQGASAAIVPKGAPAVALAPPSDPLVPPPAAASSVTLREGTRRKLVLDLTDPWGAGR